jgi:hypothetical protein
MQIFIKEFHFYANAVDRGREMWYDKEDHKRGE